MFLERKFLSRIERAAVATVPSPVAEVVRSLERILATERGVGHVLPDFGLSQSSQWSHQGVVRHYETQLRENLARYERRFELVEIEADVDDDGQLVLIATGTIAGVGAVTLLIDPLRRRVRSM